jgi:hypothetical protein
MTGTLFSTETILSQSHSCICYKFLTGFFNHILIPLFLHQEPPIKVATMELLLLEAIQREEVMTKHWDCKLVFKEEEDSPEIDLLDYVNILEQEEDKIPNNTSYTNFCLYKFPDRFNGLGDWPKLKKELHSSGIAGGCSLISNHVKSLDVGKKYHVTCHHYRTYKEKVNLNSKYVEGSDYMDGIATTTVKQN